MNTAAFRLCLLGCVVGTQYAGAQTPAAEDPGQLEHTVVEADSWEGEASLTAADLDMFQAESVADLSGLVPGFHVVTSDSRGFGDVISMRGSANTLFFAPPAVAMMIDDVPMGDVFSYPSLLLEMAEVQVLRGPQGAVYGRNAPAGLVEMRTPLPGSDLEASLAAEAGSYDLRAVRLRSGGPLGGGFSHTFQFYHRERDGYINNSTLGRATDDRSATGGMMNLFFRPDEATELRLRVFAERADDGSQRLSRLDSPDPFHVASEIPGRNDLDRRQVSFHASRDTEWGRFKSITAWQRWDLDPSVTDLDLMASTPPLHSLSTIYQKQDMFSQELRWESPEECNGWSWRTGLFLMDKTTDGDATREFPVQVEVFPTVFVPVPVAEQTIFEIEERSIAAYGRVGYSVDDRLSLSAGGRLEYVDVEIERRKTDNFANSTGVFEDLDQWLFSPELGAEYALCDETRLFARSAIGTKPAGFTAYADTPDSARFDDEVAWTNELGVRVDLPEQDLQWTLTGFWNRIHDYQVNRSDVGSTGFLVLNADRVTSFGVEGAFAWRPVECFTLRGSAGWTHAEFDDYADPLAPGVYYDGNRVPFVPEFTGSLGARYDLPAGFYVQSAVRLIGSTYFNEANEERYRQGSYWLWDAEAGWANEHLSVALYGRNLLDEEYYSFINPQINAGSPGDPQRFGLRMTLAF